MFLACKKEKTNEKFRRSFILSEPYGIRHLPQALCPDARGIRRTFLYGYRCPKLFSGIFLRPVAFRARPWYNKNMNLQLSGYRHKRICAAVSGGGDSMALLHYLCRHAEAYDIQLSAVHCEHGIRGEASAADGAFVREICEAWGVPLFMFSADCPALAAARKVSLETAARQFRYGCFDRLLKEGKADLIATAHHMGDNAETVLFNIARGASLTGAGGISDRPGYIRPLLSVTKGEILRYLQENGVACRTDETNADEHITRNAIRLQVLPALEKIVPGASGGIARFARLAQADDALLYELAAPLVAAGEGHAKVFFSEKKPLFRRACLSALKGMGVEKDYTAAHLEALCALKTAKNGERLSMPGNIWAVREYDGVAFYRARPREEREIPFTLGRFFLAGREFCAEECPARRAGESGYAALEKIPASAVFRTRREGDVFRKFGGGAKKLKEYLIDRKIPRRERDGLILLAAGKEILAVLGVEISDRIRVDEGSRVVRLALIK